MICCIGPVKLSGIFFHKEVLVFMYNFYSHDYSIVRSVMEFRTVTTFVNIEIISIIIIKQVFNWSFERSSSHFAFTHPETIIVSKIFVFRSLGTK